MDDILRKANDAYYNNQYPLQLTDEEYDSLTDQPFCRPGNTVLPLWMGSLNKVYDQKQIDRWVSKNPSLAYICMAKLDGVSCLITSNGTFTRGNGFKGYRINYNLNIPKDVAIRGELVIKKQAFRNLKSNYANERSYVCAIVNTFGYNLNDYLDFIAYELIILNSEKQLCFIDQCTFFREYDIPYVLYNVVETISKEWLLNMCEELNNYEYITDGIVITCDAPYTRQNKGNPSNFIAFKIKAVESTETTVLKVEWNMSKSGVLIPKVKTKEVYLGGTKITSFSGFNAKYIKENGIGEGAIILVTKANNIIPYILAVIKKANVTFPENISWIGSNIVNNITDIKQQNLKRMVYFIKKLNLPYIGEKTLSKLPCTSINELIVLEKNTLQSILGMVMGAKIYYNLQNIKQKPITELLAAFEAFGPNVSSERIKMLFDVWPDIMKNSDISHLDICSIKGFSTFIKNTILINFDNAKNVYNFIINTISNEPIDLQLTKQACMSGFRNEELIKRCGYKPTITITKQTDVLIVKDLTKSNKISKAKKYGIPIISLSSLIDSSNIK
ncbi:DNA ligase [Spirochaetia bacterium]|nr:DNA ligase [Spirochaetia bacterium]